MRNYKQILQEVADQINTLKTALEEKTKALDETREKLIKADEAFLQIVKLDSTYNKPNNYQRDVQNIIHNYLTTK